jgi:hypothetical protein
MGAKLKQDLTQRLIEMRELQDGQIAIVVGSCHYGRIVQRYEDYGVAIGMGAGSGWTDVDKNTLLVRVLSTGELIEII